MKDISVKFIFIKLTVLLLVNAFTFAAALLLNLIFSSMSNVLYARLIASGVAGLLFYAYIFTTVKGMKLQDTMSRGFFVLRECIVGAVFYAIPLIIALVIGMEGALTNYLFMFFMPAAFFTYLTSSPVIGYAVHLAVFAAVVAAARLVKKD